MSSRIAGGERRKAADGTVDRSIGLGRNPLRMGGSRIAGMQVADPSKLPLAPGSVDLQDPVTGALYFLADYSVEGGPDVAAP